MTAVSLSVEPRAFPGDGYEGLDVTKACRVVSLKAYKWE